MVGWRLKANWLAAAGEMIKALLAAELRPELEAVKFLEPLRSMLRSAKVARPAASVVLVFAPLSVPENELVNVILSEKRTPALVPGPAGP